MQGFDQRRRGFDDHQPDFDSESSTLHGLSQQNRNIFDDLARFGCESGVKRTELLTNRCQPVLTWEYRAEIVAFWESPA